MDDVIAGWQHREQIQTNVTMFENLIQSATKNAPNLKHISLLQGTKAYGIHIEPMKAPAKESWLRHDHQNFY